MLSGFATAQSKPPQANNTPAEAKTNSAQQAVVLDQAVNRLTFQADGTGTREFSERIHVQSEAGVRALAVLSFAYTTSNQTLDVDYVRVRKPDGTVVTTPPYNIQDMPADLTRVAPMYSDIHEKHITVRGLGVGDELEYQARYHTVHPEVPGQFWFEYSFPKNVIARDELLQITVPRDKYVKVSSPDLKPEIKDEGGTRTYTWKTSNLQVEESTPQPGPPEAPLPTVQLTTFHSWEEVGRWYSQLQAPQAAVTPAIRAKAEEVTKGLTSDDAKIQALYHYVATQFHYISLSFGIGRYQPHAAEDVLQNEYGDCKDKHTLLQALLKAEGYNAYPALINSSRKLDPNVPSPAQFDHLITAVPRGNGLQWLDTTTEIAPFGMLVATIRDKQALVMPSDKPASLVTTPADPPFPTNDVFAVEAKLDNNGTLTGHIQQTSRGDVELIFRIAFRQVPQAQWQTMVQRLSYANGFAGDVSNITTSSPEDTAKPFRFAYDYTRKDYSDWKDRLITPPMPPFGVETRSGDDDKKPKKPVVLGAPGEVVHRARVQMPAGYTPKLPKNVDLTTDFADYHSTYSLKDGVLIAERRLIMKKAKVPLAEWEAYRKFGKSIADDEDSWINLNAGNQSAEDGHNTEADRIFQEGYEALQKRDMTTAREDFRRVIQLDPKYAYAHGNLGVVYLWQNDNEDAFAELSKEEELHPENDFAYRTYAFALMRLHRNDEAMEQWRKLLKANPKNRDAAVSLSGMLITAKKYPEAVSLLENAVKLAPDSEALQSTLGFAYLKAGESAKAIPILEKIAQSATQAEPLNNIAYELADANVDLEHAQAYAEKAVAQTEAQSLLLSASSPDALKITVELASYWDTLGWVYFRRGDLAKAEPYLRAGWELSQFSTIGDHLAQVYAQQGNKVEAEHTYRLAMAGFGGDKDEIRQHYQQLTGKKLDADEGPVLLRRGKNASRIISPEDELSRIRNTKISSSSHLSGSATYALAFSAGKVNEVAYISGDTSLKPIAGRLAATKFRVEIPGPDPVKVVRRGILMCGSAGCDFTMFLPGDAARDALRSGR
ncbi:MAG TPA: DUF3857 domain-containing protein [Terriglobales bacterium]|nr:DUF3857 domain-containing protein [Terriglobales bacterium]